MDKLMEELKEKIIKSLKLTDITPEEIDADAPLIGEGLGLDSIDTLELLVMLERDYRVTVPDVNAGRRVFSSVRAMAAHIQQQQPA
ncbi:MAG: acyl carrier protein [Chitinispirillaceae bacterium]|nr:acyl carrier protein [Chitinispirillaceae bacterium]